MATIGGISCTAVRGTPGVAKQAGRTWTSPGMNGRGAKRLGFSDSDFAITVECLGTLAVCDTWILAIQALQYQTVTIVNDFDETFTGRLITKIGQPEKEPRKHPTHGDMAKVTIRIEGCAL